MQQGYTIQTGAMPITTRASAALASAITEGDECSVASMLANGVDIEALLSCPDGPDGMPVSPLMLAAMHGRANVVTMLLRADAECDRLFGSSQVTALQMCVSCGDADTAKVLIDAGAHLGRADALGRSPLYMSCLMSHPDCTELLLASRAEIEQRINRGKKVKYDLMEGMGAPALQWAEREQAWIAARSKDPLAPPHPNCPQ